MRLTIDLPENDWQEIAAMLRATQVGKNKNAADQIEQEMNAIEVPEVDAYVVDAEGQETHHPLGKVISFETNGILYVEAGDDSHQIVAAYAPGHWRMVDMRPIKEVTDEPATDGASN